MFGNIYNNRAFAQRQEEENRKKGSSLLQLRSWSFRKDRDAPGPDYIDFRLVADPEKMPEGFHPYTVHWVPSVRGEKSDGVLCTESQKGKTDMPCACCEWSNAFSQDETDEDGRVIRKSLRTKMKDYAEREPRASANVEELVDALDQFSLFNNRKIIFVGVACNVTHTQTPKEQGEGHWDNIMPARPGEGINVAFKLEVQAGKEASFLKQLSELAETLRPRDKKGNPTGPSSLFSVENGYYIRMTFTGAKGTRKLSLMKKGPMEPQHFKLVSGTNYPNVTTWGQGKGKKGAGNSMVRTYEGIKALISRSWAYKKLWQKKGEGNPAAKSDGFVYALCKFEEERDRLNIDNFEEETDIETGVSFSDEENEVEITGDPQDWKPDDDGDVDFDDMIAIDDGGGLGANSSEDEDEDESTPFDMDDDTHAPPSKTKWAVKGKK